MSTTKKSILVVDDESSNIMALTHILGPDYTIYAAKNGQNAIATAEKHLPDLILLDILMPDMNGYAVITALKNRERTKRVPVIFITGLSNAGDEEKGLALGGADYITKPFSPAIVRLRVQNQMLMLDQLRTIERLSMTDPLTALPNRHSFEIRFAAEWGRAQREHIPISILSVDLPEFNAYKHTYGHQQGDAALQMVAKVLSSELKRPSDFVARWGGEEFIVMLPNTDSEGAFFTAARIRKCIVETKIPGADGTETSLAVNIGVNTEIPPQDSFRDSLASAADQALERMKAEDKMKSIS